MANDFVQPRTRTIDVRDFAPSIHWAAHQTLPPVQGLFRRLYDGEVMYVHSGEIEVQFEDVRESVTYRTGDLLVLPPALKHRITTVTSPHVRLLGVHFDLYDELDLEFDGDMVVSERHVRENDFCYWPVTEDGNLAFSRCYRSVPAELVGWMDEIAKIFQFGRPDSLLACRGYMQLILAILLHLPHESERQSFSAYEKLLLELKAELQQNLHLPYANKTMAQRLNVSEDHFCRLFKQAFRVSPQKYLQDLRHQAAKHFLRETDYKIEYIGGLVGYEDLHNFSHVFKKWQGVSPLNYRKRFRSL